MNDRTKPPPMWRVVRDRDGTWDVFPSPSLGWPEVQVYAFDATEALRRAWDVVDMISAPHVAAELRRLVNNIPWQITSLEREPSCGDLREEIQSWLRARADEIDPTTATTQDRPANMPE